MNFPEHGLFSRIAFVLQQFILLFVSSGIIMKKNHQKGGMQNG